MRLFINELIRHYHIVFRCLVCDLVLEDMILKKKKSYRRYEQIPCKFKILDCSQWWNWAFHIRRL